MKLTIISPNVQILCPCAASLKVTPRGSPLPTGKQHFCEQHFYLPLLFCGAASYAMWGYAKRCGGIDPLSALSPFPFDSEKLIGKRKKRVGREKRGCLVLFHYYLQFIF